MCIRKSFLFIFFIALTSLSTKEAATKSGYADELAADYTNSLSAYQQSVEEESNGDLLRYIEESNVFPASLNSRSLQAQPVYYGSQPGMYRPEWIMPPYQQQRGTYWPANSLPADESLLSPGDIPNAWRPLVRNTPLSAFNGQWAIILDRSDSMDNILTALGLPQFKRRIMENHKGKTTVVVRSPHLLYMENLLPGNSNVVGADVPLGGQAFSYQEKETGEWISRAYFVNGRLGQIRNSPKGTMYDVRAIFSSDPQGLYQGPGPLMLFRWTFAPSDYSDVYSVDRWLRLVA